MVQNTSDYFNANKKVQYLNDVFEEVDKGT